MSFLSTKPISHRGIHDNVKVPENSIEAFKKCIKKGYIIELDVHLLKDNEIVVFHDDNLLRMTGVNKKIKNTTYKELQELNLLNTKYKIPKLIDVLNLVDGKVPLLIELKYDNPPSKLEKELVKLLDNYKGEFSIQSFHPMIINWFKKNRPNYLRGLLVPSYGKSIKRIVLASMLLKGICKPNFISVDVRRNNKRLLKKDIETLVWTIRSKDEYDKYINKYNNLIIDDMNILN